jgi:hypothetical protein
VNATTWVRASVLPLILLMSGRAAAGREVVPEVVCTVPGAALADVRTPFNLALEFSGEAVLVRFGPAAPSPSYLLVRMPGCTLVPLASGALPPGSQQMAVHPGGARLIATARYPEGSPEWWYSPAPEVPLASVPPAADGRVAGQPILSDDGAWAVWVQQKPGTGTQSWHARELLGTRVRHGDTSAFGTGSYEVIGYDPGRETMTFARNLSEIIDVDTRSGQASGPPLRPRDVASQPGTFRRFRTGWFAWDAYRDDTPWRAVWSVGGRPGRYDVDWSKMISHATVNPSGTHAALSLDTRFGRIPAGSEALVLVRLSDGKEIFRKRLARFTRTRVAFLGDRHLAWTEEGAVVVARVPE